MNTKSQQKRINVLKGLPMGHEPLGPMPKDNYESGTVSGTYADWMERRAERAEELLREAKNMLSLLCTCGACAGIGERIKAHFKEVAP